ncbi:MAG: hypothetical protein ACRDK8_11430, partial [Solirubrobacteraceae bacterium]
MENEDSTPDNVYGLFPGIDTTPFGASTPATGADHGWSATPEPTIADADDQRPSDVSPAAGDPRRLAHDKRAHLLSRAAVWMLVALLTGGALAAAHVMLSPAGSTPHSASLTTHVPPASSYRAAAPAKTPSSSHVRVARRPSHRSLSTARKARRHAPAAKAAVQVQYVTRATARAGGSHSTAAAPATSTTPIQPPPASTPTPVSNP